VRERRRSKGAAAEVFVVGNSSIEKWESLGGKEPTKDQGPKEEKVSKERKETEKSRAEVS